MSGTILVVDDHPCLRDVARLILEHCGYRVLTAANGEEATRLARRNAGINLLLTDLEMPGMRGDVLARWFRRYRPLVPVVFMSGNDDLLRSLKAAWAVAKPFIHIDVLINTVRQALAHCEETILATPLAA